MYLNGILYPSFPFPGGAVVTSFPLQSISRPVHKRFMYLWHSSYRECIRPGDAVFRLVITSKFLLGGHLAVKGSQTGPDFNTTSGLWGDSWGGSSPRRKTNWFSGLDWGKPSSLSSKSPRSRYWIMGAHDAWRLPETKWSQQLTSSFNHLSRTRRSI